jgi:triacylglycerol lipase
MLKPLPPPTIDSTFPPNKGFRYYENRLAHPFKPEATTFEMVNAWWLAEAALLAYADVQFAAQAFKQAGLSLGPGQPFTGRSTQCYVAHDDQCVIVSFRGTQVLKPGETATLEDTIHDVIKDICADSKFKLIAHEPGGRVHAGFKMALGEVWSTQVKPYLDSLLKSKPNRKVWFTGHSLGAALATLAAQSYGTPQGLYTFGSPMIGDEAFAESFRVKNTYRFVNNNDIVTRVAPVGPCPPLGVAPYKHVGQLKYIGSSGRVADKPGLLQSLEDRLLGNFKAIAGQFKSKGPDWLKTLPIDHLNDHAPLYYAIHTWNNV